MNGDLFAVLTRIEAEASLMAKALIGRGLPRNWERRGARRDKKNARQKGRLLLARIPSLRVACEHLGLSHWHVSRTLGPGNWPLLYLNVCRHYPQRKLADVFGVAPSMVCKRLRKVRERLARAGLPVAPAAWQRPRRPIAFTDCEGARRRDLLRRVPYFERSDKVPIMHELKRRQSVKRTGGERFR